MPPTVNWPGMTQTYGFQLHAIGVSYFERPGVYIFCYQLPNGQWRAVYVGETDSFSRRLTTELALHHQWDSIRAAGATHICTLHVTGDRAARLAIETDLRQSLNPSCNQQ